MNFIPVNFGLLNSRPLNFSLVNFTAVNLSLVNFGPLNFCPVNFLGKNDEQIARSEITFASSGMKRAVG